MNDTAAKTVAPPETAPAKPKVAAKRMFRVRKGCNFFTAEGKKRQGEVVELTSAEAKRFNKLQMLDPYLDDDEDEGE